MRSPRQPFAQGALLITALVLACSSGSEAPPPTLTATFAPETPVPSPTAAEPSPAATSTATPASAASTPTPPVTPQRRGQTEPTGFPIDPGSRLGIVVGEPGARTIDWTAGSTAAAYSEGAQASDDPEAANAMGWNCRVHVEYEGVPAVDWYIPTGTPVRATMDGLASLYVISLPNAFDYYGVDREPYLSNPDRERAPLSAFPGPGGGKGVYVEVVNSDYATEYAHLDLAATLGVVPDDRYADSYSAGFDYEGAFSEMRAFNDETLIATWPVRAGDVIGYSGDSGYSEAPHLHYTVRRLPTGGLLCPTDEPGFEDGGWLFH